ncbi:DUF4062 domain-containing protein [Methylobacterium radiotolerans]|uniref:DUF4062 domain-containing protein n=1 Tax=Methylobacterium radiotolerans TaxID=31998 RepID=UPI0015889ADE|nr:DUF4062 domain-containing protein [Methylobacterium radiotolerans]
MSGLKVFVSSTCVDLGAERAQMRSLLLRLGHEPIMSDYSDVLYDPRAHTHASCVREVSNADALVLLVGSRFGGTTVPQAVSLVDIDALKNSSNKVEVLSSKDRLSITQMEVFKAIENGIPVFTFVDSRVYADHHVYQTNKSSGIIDKIKFPSIAKPETATYIFEFLNFVNHRVLNNSIIAYRNFSDIEEHLVKQWSLLFQRLLQEERVRATEARRAEIVIDQLEDMKAVILQSIAQGNPRDAARNVLKFRRLVDFILGFRSISSIDFVNFSGSLNDLMKEVGIVNIRHTNNSSYGRAALILEDGTYFSLRMPYSFIRPLHAQWAESRGLDTTTKQAIIDAVGDANTAPPIRYVNSQYVDENDTENQDYNSLNVAVASDFNYAEIGEDKSKKTQETLENTAKSNDDN